MESSRSAGGVAPVTATTFWATVNRIQQEMDSAYLYSAPGADLSEFYRRYTGELRVALDRSRAGIFTPQPAA